LIAQRRRNSHGRQKSPAEKKQQNRQETTPTYGSASHAEKEREEAEAENANSGWGFDGPRGDRRWRNATVSASLRKDR
jgi:hypothetical protein